MATCSEADTNDKSSVRGACLKEKRVASMRYCPGKLEN